MKVESNERPWMFAGTVLSRIGALGILAAVGLAGLLTLGEYPELESDFFDTLRGYGFVPDALPSQFSAVQATNTARVALRTFVLSSFLLATGRGLQGSKDTRTAYDFKDFPDDAPAKA